MQDVKKYDVVIIGAGVIGCSVARYLSRYRLKAAVIEKEAEPAMGSSGANSGLVHAGFDPHPGSNKAKFNVEGAKMYPELAKELHVHYEQSGALVVAFNEEERAILDELLENGKVNGVEQLRIVEKDELHELEPKLSDKAVAALYAPTAGLVCPYGMTAALADDAAANDVDFYRETAVSAIAHTDIGYVIATDKGDFYADAVVNAAGLFADRFNNMISSEKLTIKPNRGEYWLVDKALAGTFKRTLFRTPTAAGKGILVSPTVDGTLLVGPTAEWVDDKSDVKTTQAGLDAAFDGAKILWPELTRSSFITTFAGNRAKGENGDFVIGEVSDSKGFFNAACIESPGLSSAPAIGKYLAEKVAERLCVKEKSEGEIVPYKPQKAAFALMNSEERAAAIAEDSGYGKIVCRCETVTEAEIRDSIRRPVGARTVDGVKHRTRAGMGRCQGGFCMPVVVEILCEELGLTPEQITKNGNGSELLVGKIWEENK